VKTVAAIYTAQALVEPMTGLFKEILPDCKLVNIVDNHLIADVIASGKVTKGVTKRMLYYYQAGAATGADIILNTCSSVGEVVNLARKFIDTPIVKIDEPMVAAAINKGNKIGVLATLPTTLEPTVKLISGTAAEMNKEVDIIRGLAEGGFQALMEGDTEQHDQIILDTANKIANSADVLVLAQGSMARMEKLLQDEIGKPVFSSPRLAVLHIKDLLKG